LRCLAALGASLPLSAAWAGESVGAAPGVNGPEVMLYFAQPIGPSTSARSYGLRIDQHSLPSILPASTANATDLSGRREIINLRVAAHENLRIDFGRRVSWDFSRRQFNLPGDLPAMKAGFPTHTLAAAVPLRAAAALPVPPALP
jgi:hypothetical protein